MPVRDGLKKESSLKADASRHEGTDDRLLQLAQQGANYLRLKKEDTKLAKEIKEQGDKIKTAVDDPTLYSLNGKHKEIYAPLGDGMNEVFFQLQCRESVSTVPNIVELLRQKLGAKAEAYIMKVEVLHDSTLQSLLASGDITNDDILEWTTTKETYALSVKMNKKKS